MLEKTSSYVKSLTDGSNYGRSGVAIPGLLSIFARLTEFVQIMSFYVFLDMSMPPNLNLLVQSLYDSLQIQALPFNVPFPFFSNSEFQRPSIFASQDFGFDWINNNFTCIVQLVGLVFLYYLLSLLSRQSEHCLMKQLQSRFGKTFYANSLEAYLSSHSALAFGAVAVTLDRAFVNRYKIYNLAVVCTMMFIVLMLPIFHPLVLRINKMRTASVNNEDCYRKAKPRARRSELYVMSRLLLLTTVAVSIPLCAAWLSLSLVLVACLFHGVCIFRC